jgi:hypothetical protein
MKGLGLPLANWHTLFISNLSWAFMNIGPNKVTGFDISPRAEKKTAATYIKEGKKICVILQR